MNIERAIQLNRKFGNQLRWQPRFDQIVFFLGFQNRTPGVWEFAESIAKWQKREHLVADGIIGPRTWLKMKKSLDLKKNVPLQPIHSGPQTFGPAIPGSIPIDLSLMAKNKDIERRLLLAAEDYYARKDFRWLFAFAHGQITKQINQHISRFQRPNALLRLNRHFAEQFLRDVNQQPHDGWKRAFKACHALQQGSEDTSLLMGEVEFCGAAMASIHIHIDLAAALDEIGCIPPQDYGNMLVFVKRGSLAALVRLRGRALGAAEAMLEQLIAPFLKLEVKVWRNTVYKSACNIPVPNPDPKFI